MSMSTLFSDGIDVTECDLPPLLPLVHTVSTIKGLKYISNNSLPKPPDCERCEVFPLDNPVYLFYGKPTYKKLNKETTRDPADHKMIFILKNYPYDPNDIIRVFTFDSGAFYHGLYNGYIDSNNYSLDDFEMSTDINELPKHICYFWGNNTNFIKYRSPKLINSSGLSFAIKIYADLIGSRRKEVYDSRCSVPEIQSEEIHYFLDYLQAILVSDEIYNEYFGKNGKYEFLKEDIEIIPYNMYGRESASDISAVYNCVLEYYRSKEVL